MWQATDSGSGSGGTHCASPRAEERAAAGCVGSSLRERATARANLARSYSSCTRCSRSAFSVASRANAIEIPVFS